MKYLLGLLLSLSLFGCACSKPAVKPALRIPDVTQSDDAKEVAKLPLLGAEGTPDHAVLVLGLVGSVNDDMAKSVMVSLGAVSKIDEVAGVVLEINSPGGSVDAGFVVARAIELSPKPVACVVDGEADSMAYYILQSCKVRAMTRRSLLMAHNAIFTGEFNLTSGSSVDNIRNHIEAEREAMLWQYSHRTKVPLAEFRKRLENEREWWMTADESLKIGAVDRLVDSSKQLADQLSATSSKP